MRLLIINPNTTASMTKKVEIAAKEIAQSTTEITAINPEQGPASIQGVADGEAALPGLFEIFEREIMTKQAYDMVIIACFDDTGLMELKKRSPVPVLGIGEAAFHTAMLMGAQFSVVTTLSVSIPVIEENLVTYGLANRCARVRASEVPVLALEDPTSDAAETIAQEIATAQAEDGCDSIVLGCAGMADLAERMERRFGLPIIDGVVAAVSLCEALHRVRLAGTKAT